MERWIANGAQLAWLIDSDKQTVYVYQKDQPVETRRAFSSWQARARSKASLFNCAASGMG
jgi:Uma2 family endonuclease